jgi:2-amino-4-hydroxy-6-hydroxymethyldihydropteridine diphosphokinase
MEGQITMVGTREFAVGLGSNLGNRAEWLFQACQWLESVLGEPVAASSVWESEPWGYASPNPYLNQVMIFRSDKEAMDLLVILMKVEKHMGRVRPVDGGMADRCIDLDLLWVDQEILPSVSEPPTEGQLRVPHPRLHLRRFVLEPLAEIRPEWNHPVMGLSVMELLSQCQDQGPVRRVDFEIDTMAEIL